MKTPTRAKASPYIIIHSPILFIILFLYIILQVKHTDAQKSETAFAASDFCVKTIGADTLGQRLEASHNEIRFILIFFKSQYSENTYPIRDTSIRLRFNPIRQFLPALVPLDID